MATGEPDRTAALGVRAIENTFSIAFHHREDLLAAFERDAAIQAVAHC